MFKLGGGELSQIQFLLYFVSDQQINIDTDFALRAKQTTNITFTIIMNIKGYLIVEIFTISNVHQKSRKKVLPALRDV